MMLVSWRGVCMWGTDIFDSYALSPWLCSWVHSQAPSAPTDTVTHNIQDLQLPIVRCTSPDLLIHSNIMQTPVFHHACCCLSPSLRLSLLHKQHIVLHAAVQEHGHGELHHTVGVAHQTCSCVWLLCGWHVHMLELCR